MKLNLVINVMAAVLICHAAAFCYQLGPHPRIFVNEQQLPVLAERAQGALSGEYATIKSVADKAVAEGIRERRSRYQTPEDMICLGICYLVEGALGRPAGRYADVIKKYWGNGDIMDLEGDGSFGFHALVYDWIYDSLSHAERKLYGDHLGNWLRHYTGVAEITLKSGHWWYNQTWGPSHLNTPHARDAITSKLFISLALKGAGTVHESDTESFLASWTKRIPEECIPAFDEMGGVWSESMGHGTYGPIEVIPWALEAWRTASGEDYFQLCAEESYPRAMTLWAANLVVPFNGHTACIDDNGGGKPRVFSRVAPLLAARYRDPVANYFSDLGYEQGWTEIPWRRFLFYDPTVQSSTPAEQNYSLAHHFAGSGHIYMRSAWGDPDATWAFFGVGPKLAGHSRDDEGHFLIARKGWLVMRGGGQGSNEDNLYAGGSLMFNLVTIYDPDEEFRRTEKRRRPNGPEVVNNENDGGLMRYVYSSNERDNRGKIVAYHHDRNLTYAAADITEGYFDGKVNEVTRQLLYLRGQREFFIVFDRIEAKSAEYPKTWYIHMPGEPTVSGNETAIVPDHVLSYRGNQATWLSDDAGLDDVASSGHSRAFLKTLLPKNPVVVKRGGEGYDFWGNLHEPSAQYNHTGAGSERPPIVPWRLEVEPSGKAARQYFLHVLEVTDEGVSEMTEVGLIERGGYMGVRIATPDGPAEILFASSGPLTGRVKLADADELVIEP